MILSTEEIGCALAGPIDLLMWHTRHARLPPVLLTDARQASLASDSTGYPPPFLFVLLQATARGGCLERGLAFMQSRVLGTVWRMLSGTAAQRPLRART